MIDRQTTAPATHIAHHFISRIAGVLAFSLLCLLPANVLAQVSTTRLSNGAIVSQTQPRASSVVPDAHPKAEQALPPGATVIYSNFGTGNALYNAGTGWTEAGQQANDYPLAEAMSFTPQSTYDVVRIDVAVTYLQGTNGMRLVLAADNAGVPGTIIHTFKFTNLPAFGTCCTVETVKLAQGKIQLAAGQTYWLYPLPQDTTGYLIWNYDTTNMGGAGAVSKDYGKTWTSATYATFGAFDVLGVLVGQ